MKNTRNEIQIGVAPVPSSSASLRASSLPRPPSPSKSSFFSPRPLFSLPRLSIFILFISLFLLFSFSFGTTYTSKYGGTLPASTAFGSGLYLKAAALAGAVMVMMLAVMYMIGQFLQSEEIKQLARSELMQAFASVIIAACLLGLILFSDVAMEQVSHQIVSPCEGASSTITSALTQPPLKDSPTLNRYAYCYMATLNEMASAQGRTTMLQSLDAAAKAYKSEGFQTDLWWLLYGGMTRRPGAHYRMDSEIHGMEFELLTKYMLSLRAQLVVLQVIIPALGPALLFLGVIFRSLIYTRKLGGMMLAAAAGLLLVWPALYLLSWFTLQVAVYGPQVMGDLPEAGCPASCTTVPPSGYRISENPDGNVWNAPDRHTATANGAALPYPYAYAKGALARSDMLRVPPQDDPVPAVGNTAAWQGYGIQTCFPTSDDSRSKITVAQSEACPAECRYLPMPTDYCNMAACDQIPLACHVIRAASPYDPSGEAIDGPPNCQCPEFCKFQLPQVKYADPTNPTSSPVVPTTNAVSCSGTTAPPSTPSTADNCDACPLYCRAYTGKAGEVAVMYDTTDCQSCKKCLTKLDTSAPSPTNLPDCMTGVPAAMASCNDACGAPMTLKAALDAVAATPGLKDTVCPLDCRVFFDSAKGEDKYKDPAFVKECEGTFKAACNKCTSYCKVLATPLIAPSTSVAGVKCTSAPTYDTTQTPPVMSSDVSTQCRRCPMSCRFSNPSSIADYSNPADYFYSHSHYALECNYYTQADYNIPYDPSKPCDVNGYPSTWFRRANYAPVWTASADDPDPPLCAPRTPTNHIYKRISATSDPLCPLFAADTPEYLVWAGAASGLNEISAGTPYLQAYARPNNNVSAECNDPEVQKYCSSPYCESSCVDNRVSNGPFYCHLTDPYIPLTSIPDNSQRCKACYTDTNGDRTMGPQCQVLLLSGQQSGILPKGCSQNCLPDTTANRGGNCNGFCYPQLAIPSSDKCLAYQSNPTSDPAREFASCSACPYDCRYDYTYNAEGAKIPDQAKAACGLGANAILDKKNCQLRTCNGLVGEWYTTCTNSDHRYTCAVEGSTATYWKRATLVDIALGTTPLNCNSNLVRKSTDALDSETYAAGGTYHTGVCDPAVDPANVETFNGNCVYKNNWYVDKCSMSSDAFTLQTNYQAYLCTPNHKYPHLDEVINGHPGAIVDSDYLECGTINPDGNANLNLCGTQSTAAGARYTLCFNDVSDKNSCYAHYDALKVSCLPMTGTTTDQTSPANAKIQANDNCQNLPFFCRVQDGGTIGVCPTSPWTAGGAKPEYGTSPRECNLDPSYCGVDKSTFNIGTDCQPPTNGSGVGCPARCRLDIPNLPMPYGCDSTASGNDIATACRQLNPACRGGQPPSNPCALCGECFEDRRNTPLMRSHCEDICSSDQLGAGAPQTGPRDLLMNWQGAMGNKDWRSLGSLGIASFLLPIFCIILTLAFIRSLSPILGGDIEIPGLMKLL